jgi:Tol biopolymer transport system component
MKPELWTAVETLFAQARELPADRRPEFLNQANPATEVRAEVEALLVRADTGALDLSGIVRGAASMLPPGPGRTPLVTAGQSLGPYRVLERIGSGAMGEVYAAEDARLGRKVALKILPRAFAADPDRISRFLTEARAASALNHPNIVTVFDLGNEAGLYYIATEFIEGRTLRSMMQPGPLAWQTAVDIATQAAEALEAAHRSGIIHRDIKPENIMVRPDGYVRVLDFGLAKLLAPAGGAPDSTVAGMVMGTPAYMSPEQARARPLGPRSDLFSLGVVLYEMLSGRAPFRRSTTVETLAALLEREPDPVELRAGAPGELGRILSRLLEKDPEKRFADAAALVAALRGVAAPAPRTSRRMVLAAGAGAAAAGIGGGWWLLRPTGLRLDSMQVRRISPPQGLIRALITPDGRDLVMITTEDRDMVVSAAPLGNPAASRRVATFPAGYCLGASFRPQSKELWIAVESREKDIGGDLYRIVLPQGAPQQVFHDIASEALFRPAGDRIAFARATRDVRSLYVANPDGSGAKMIGMGPEFSSYVGFDWTSDGRSLLYIEGGLERGKRIWKLMRAPVEGGQARAIYSDPMPLTEIAALRGDLLVLTAGVLGTRRYQLHYSYRGGPFKPFTNDSYMYSRVSADAEGKRLVAPAANYRHSLWTVDLPGENGGPPGLPRRVPVEHMTGGQPSWASDGRLVYSADSGTSSDIFIANPDGSSPQKLTSGARLNDHAVVTPDLKTVFFMSNRDGRYRIWRMGIDGSNAAPLTAGPNDGGPLLSYDGAWVYYATQMDSRWAAFRIPAQGGTPEHVLEDAFNPPHVSPYGQMLAYHMRDPVDRRRKLILRRTDSATVLQTLDGTLAAAGFTPDSRELVYLSYGFNLTEIRYCRVSGGAPKTLVSLPFGSVERAALSRDGRRVVFTTAESETDLFVFDNFR